MLPAREQISNMTLALCFTVFISSNFTFLTNQFRLSILILLIFNSMIVVTAMIRRPPERVSLSAFDITVTMIGTYSVLFFVGSSAQQENIFLQFLGIVGLIISVTGFVFLNKSFGLLPADRGIIKGGIYKLIRHPIYAGYFISNSCFLAQNFTVYNIIVFSCFVICETTRLLREEKLLKQNPDYLKYTKETRWRILPYIW